MSGLNGTCLAPEAIGVLGAPLGWGLAGGKPELNGFDEAFISPTWVVFLPLKLELPDTFEPHEDVWFPNRPPPPWSLLIGLELPHSQIGEGVAGDPKSDGDSDIAPNPEIGLAFPTNSNGLKTGFELPEPPNKLPSLFAVSFEGRVLKLPSTPTNAPTLLENGLSVVVLPVALRQSLEESPSFRPVGADGDENRGSIFPKRPPLVSGKDPKRRSEVGVEEDVKPVDLP
jgi:hypothetical protein